MLAHVAASLVDQLFGYLVFLRSSTTNRKSTLWDDHPRVSVQVNLICGGVASYYGSDHSDKHPRGLLAPFPKAPPTHYNCLSSETSQEQG
jgi:hypothetical protein